MMAVMIIAIFWIGLNPQPVLNACGPALDGIRNGVSSAQTTERGEAK